MAFQIFLDQIKMIRILLQVINHGDSRMLQFLKYQSFPAECSVIHLVLRHTLDCTVLVQSQMTGLPDCTCTA